MKWKTAIGAGLDEYLVHMGIEMVLHLVSKSHFQKILEMTWTSTYEAMEKQTLRKSRPRLDSRLHRIFDIDSEAEILDWMDSLKLEEYVTTISNPRLLNVLQKATIDRKITLEQACDGLLHIAEWASIGNWEAWEGRSFIYIETLLDTMIEDVDELYRCEVWNNVFDRLQNMTEAEYVEAVIMNWMRRRETLGKTLDESADPHILPTAQSHTNVAGLLHYSSQLLSNKEYDLFPVLGREHLKSNKWGLDENNLEQILNHSISH